jgi:CPA2 family monovalent cation:H+ antiporter-2
MPHHSLIATIVIGLGLAFVFGALAHRLRVPPLVGYLVAGVVIGPFTPGYVADQTIALQLAEVGIILLMFGVGLHFSLNDLLSVKGIAIPGAIGQMAIVTALGFGLARAMGWSFGAGIVFGCGRHHLAAKQHAYGLSAYAMDAVCAARCRIVSCD